MYRRVVVPLDGSEIAEDILPHIVELIRGRSSDVYLLSVTPVLRGVTPSFVDLRASRKEEQARIKQELEVYLWTIAERLEPVAANVQVTVLSGRPAEGILAFVSEADADLIAMSTHGRSGIGQWVFGTVTDRVLRGAVCPVLLVRPQQTHVRVPYQRIVVPLDGSELAERIVPHIQGLIRDSSPESGTMRNAYVFLVSVLATGLGDRPVALLTSYPPGLQLTTTALDHAEVELRGYLRSVATALRKQGIGVQIAVRRGAPADEILAYADEVAADLIGMTTHSSSGKSRWVRGSVASKVLEGARNPVLLIRPTP